jgi:Tol biopolymer transport system component
VWFDRSGRRLDTPMPADHYTQLELSFDGRYVAAERFNPDEHEPDILVSDLVRRVTWRATDNPANDESPIWSADSKRFLYARHDGIMQPAQLVEHAVEESQDERTVYRSADSKHPVDWSADGRFILYKVTGMTRKSDIWAVSASGRQEPVPLLATDADEIDARLSRDGRFLAYVSDESGRFEVYVTPFHSPGERWLVSSAGGAQPRWRADGQELIYISSGKEVMSVRVHSGGPFSADAPRTLFSLDRIVPEPFTRVPYTMSADAQRFLVGTLVREPASSPINVMINWTSRVDAGTSFGAAHP